MPGVVAKPSRLMIANISAYTVIIHVIASPHGVGGGVSGNRSNPPAYTSENKAEIKVRKHDDTQKLPYYSVSNWEDSRTNCGNQEASRVL